MTELQDTNQRIGHNRKIDIKASDDRGCEGNRAGDGLLLADCCRYVQLKSTSALLISRPSVSGLYYEQPVRDNRTRTAPKTAEK